MEGAAGRKAGMRWTGRRARYSIDIKTLKFTTFVNQGRIELRSLHYFWTPKNSLPGFSP